MATTLRTLLLCFAANQRRVSTPNGIGTIQAVEKYGDLAANILVSFDTENHHFSTAEITPILAGFSQFRAAAIRGEQFAKQALYLIGDAVAKIKVSGRQRYPTQTLEMGLDAALNQVHPTAQGYGRVSWDLAPFWNPLNDPKSDPRQWQPIVVPSFDELLLANGYAAGIPAKQWITEDGVGLTYRNQNDN